MRDGVGAVTGQFEEADEHRRIADDERRHTPHGVRVDVRRVLLLDRRQRASAVDLRPQGLEVGTGGGEDRRQIGAVLDLTAGCVAVLEQRVVDVEEDVRLGVPRGDRRLQGEQTAVRFGALPDRRLTLGDVRLAEGERQERDVPVGPRTEALDDVVVGDAGVRAAVVVGQSEAAGHEMVNESTERSIPQAPDDAPGRRVRARRRSPSRRPHRRRGGCGRRPGWWRRWRRRSTTPGRCAGRPTR